MDFLGCQASVEKRHRRRGRRAMMRSEVWESLMLKDSSKASKRKIQGLNYEVSMKLEWLLS